MGIKLVVIPKLEKECFLVKSEEIRRGDRQGRFGGEISGNLKVREGLFRGNLWTPWVLLLAWQQLVGKGEEASGWRGAGERPCGQRNPLVSPGHPWGTEWTLWEHMEAIGLALGGMLAFR